MLGTCFLNLVPEVISTAHASKVIFSKAQQYLANGIMLMTSSIVCSISFLHRKMYCDIAYFYAVVL